MTPTQEIEFLGIMVNANTLLVSLPADKAKETWAEAIRIFHCQRNKLCTSELLAAMLAVKTFPMDTLGVSVLLQLDIATAVAYIINNMRGGGVQCRASDVGSQQEYHSDSRGVSNTITDIESQTV